MTDAEKVAEDFVRGLTVTWPTPYAKGEKAEREAIRVLTAALRAAKNEGLDDLVAWCEGFRAGTNRGEISVSAVVAGARSMKARDNG